MHNKLSEIVGQRINTLLGEQNKLQKELAQYLGVKDNVISYFCSGSRIPNVEQVTRIAEFFNTTADYLLGMSAVSTRNEDIQDICSYTGLSQGFVAACHVEMVTESTSIQRFLSLLGTNDSISDMVVATGKYKQFAAHPQKCFCDIEGETIEMDMQAIIKSYVTDLFWRIIDEGVENAEE